MSILRNIVCPKWGTGLRELGMKNSAYCLFVYVSNFRSSDPSDRILVIPLFRIVLASQKGEDEA